MEQTDFYSTELTKFGETVCDVGPLFKCIDKVTGIFEGVLCVIDECRSGPNLDLYNTK